jgi:sialic acid synthase SpsE
MSRGKEPLFIAEASRNHDRDLDRALAFVDAAADAGCDAVKFQVFRIARMFAPEILAKSAKHHCWLPEEIAPVIARIRESFVADGTGLKAPQPSELSDREWRADPSDGMRPLKHIRMNWESAA